MSRNLVVCCDGTSNKFEDENTNVVRIVQVLRENDPNQLVFYDPGVGTLPGEMLRDKIRTAIDLAFATGLAQNVTEAYAWLMSNWRPDDKIYVFGFSRGAYTARVVAALLHHIGLLPAGSENLIPYALRLLRSARKDEETAGKLGDEFRRTFARPNGDPERRVKTHFVGVWDTVSAVGWIWDPVKYRFSATNPSISTIRHAIAIDEHRAFFTQNRMYKAARENPAQDLQQLWFAGVHCDVGGGYGDTKLWRCAFDWMIAEARLAGLDVDDTRLARIAPPIAEPWLQGQHESLRKWWILAEFFPKLHWNSKKGKIKNGKPVGGHDWRFNLFRKRHIEEGELLHATALERIRNKPGYAPSNLSKEFQRYVKGLAAVPAALPYAKTPIAAPVVGLTPQTP